MQSSQIFRPRDGHANCTSWSFLESNSDISGIGVRARLLMAFFRISMVIDGLYWVVASFLFSAYLTLLLVIIQHLLPSGKLQMPPGQNQQKSLVPTFLRLQNIELSKQLTNAVESTILTLSDLQLLTSFAVLISGYAQLSRGISLYHWSTMVDLAWFSALAHLATLTSLRHFFRERPIVALFRVFGMGLVLTLLSMAYYPTGYMEYIFDYLPSDLEDFESPMNNPPTYFMSLPTKCLYSASSRDAAFMY
ncbi:MAG: hypothetical protein Q9168_007255 [Polycauliona sp. 1 TL-2023]